MNQNNGIPIIPFFGNKKDNQLQELTTFQINLSEATDVRQNQKSVFGFERYLEYPDQDKLFNHIFNNITAANNSINS